MKKENKNFHQLYSAYCCLDLWRAVESEIFTEVVSGILYYDKNHKGCGGEVRIRFCPFCGAEIITEKTETGWNWHTESLPHPKR